MSRRFPSTHFGKCYKCGRQAADNGGTSADVSPTYTAKRGLKLTYFRGEWWCDICITDEKSDEHSERVADIIKAEDQFRARAGFVKEIT